MRKLITLFIGCSLALAASGHAKKPGDNPDAPKKPKKQQVAPHQPQPKAATVTGPKKQPLRRMVVPPRETPAAVQSARVQKLKGPQVHKETDQPIVNSEQQAVIPSLKQAPNNNELLKPKNRHLKDARLNPQAIERIRAQHRNFKARPNTSIAGVQFNQNYQISKAQTWSGSNYQVFRSYRPQWHDQGWWRTHYTRVSLIGGGWYYWNAGYWYPAWGYDESAAYYPYDGPIYSGPSARPFDQVVADVQAVLQEQGYYRGEVDGLLGPLTRQALAEYQSAAGLYATETIDEPTLESLGLAG